MSAGQVISQSELHMTSVLIRNTVALTMNPPGAILHGNIFLEEDRIVEIPSQRTDADVVLDGEGFLTLPGFVQSHVHLNQTLFRGLADDMDVVDWLRLRIWPLEQAHDFASVHAASRLSLAELIRSGTTAALAVETARHTEAAFQAAEEMGFRATIGNAIMDRWEAGTEMQGLTTEESLEESLFLLDRYHHSANDRLRYAFTPRGTRNATDEMWQRVVELAQEKGTIVHTHAAENKQQSERLEAYGGREIFYLHSMGALQSNLVLAHGVWLTEAERELVASSGVKVVHCPSANLKLASGIALVPEMLEAGITVGLGADGAPCNNNLDPFNEMRLAALIHKPRQGPKVMDAVTVLWMMTLAGAKALGREDEIGSLEAGKKADIVLVRRESLHAWPQEATDPHVEVVYEHRADDVDTVLIDGQILLRGGEFTRWQASEIMETAAEQRSAVLQRFEAPDG
jgi:5-methylthioadenosine/S-adenosylhomocysteine deaminase